ncbi:MAG: Rid family hydrolase [Acidobacteriota bacterium]
MSREPGAQFESAYRALRRRLRAEGGSPKHVVREFVFFRDIRRDLGPVLDSRRRVVGRLRGPTFYIPASTLIEQPPLDPDIRAEIAFHALIPHRGETGRPKALRFGSHCPCGECSRPSVREFRLDKTVQLRAGNIYGTAGPAYEETVSMFRSSDRILRQHGMSFLHVARTWIHLRHIDRDYAEFNRGRRDFFREAGVEPPPASTGIGGAPYAGRHSLLLSFDAIKAVPQPEFLFMTTPTLNEAWSYGSDFSRGLRVADGNKETLFVSGTASVDESGRTVHAEDCRAQIERMLLNISTLLRGQGASLDQIVLLTTYLKEARDADCLREALAQQGLADVPNALVQAAVCRPDLLCEMEALAVRPL